MVLLLDLLGLSACGGVAGVSVSVCESRSKTLTYSIGPHICYHHPVVGLLYLRQSELALPTTCDGLYLHGDTLSIVRTIANVLDSWLSLSTN